MDTDKITDNEYCEEPNTHIKDLLVKFTGVMEEKENALNEVDELKAQNKKLKEEKLQVALNITSKLNGHCQYCVGPLPEPNECLPLYYYYYGSREEATEVQIGNTCSSCWYSKKVCAVCKRGPFGDSTWLKSPPKVWEGIISRVGGGWKNYCANCLEKCYFCKTRVRRYDDHNDFEVCKCEAPFQP